jgi:hypothetical protein
MQKPFAHSSNDDSARHSLVSKQFSITALASVILVVLVSLALINVRWSKPVADYPPSSSSEFSSGMPLPQQGPLSIHGVRLSPV